MSGSRYATGGRTTQGSRYATGGATAGSSRYSQAEDTPPPSIADQLKFQIASNPSVRGAVGLGRNVADLISRGVYASAGAAEEAFSPVGGGVGAVPGRVGRELFSGLPFTDIQGDKREFTEVMERAGVGEMGRLGDVVPISPLMPAGGLLADITGRGAVGFAANVALDPTTYVTAGGSTVGRFATSKGVLNLSRKGLKVKDEMVNDLALTYKMLDESADKALAEEGRRQVRTVLEGRVREAVQADPKLLEKTGLKFAGMEVVSPRLVKNLTAPVKQMIESAPWGARAARVAEASGNGFRRAFDKFADLHGLDDDVREGVKNKIRDYENSVAASNHREAQPWDAIRADEARLAKKYGSGDKGVQVLGKKFADWREGTGTPSLTTEEKALFERVAKNIDIRSEVNVRNGVISGEQYDKYKGWFLHHDYKNKEVLVETMARDAAAEGLLPAARVNKERQFETLAEAVDVSSRLNKLGVLNRERGGSRAVYGALVPEYSISKNLWSHIEQSNRSVFQKKLLDDITESYGLKMDEFFDPSRVYALNEPIPVTPKDNIFIDGFVEKHGTLKDLAESLEVKSMLQDTRLLGEARKSLDDAWKSWQEVKYTEGLGSTQHGKESVETFNKRLARARTILDDAKSAATKNGRVLGRGEGWEQLNKEVKDILPRLTPDGQREFARQLASMARDESHILRVQDAVGDALMPNIKARREFDIDPFFLKHGLPEGKAQLVSRGGGLWGDQPHLIPKAIADMVDDAPRDLLADKLMRKNMGGLVNTFDKVGNFFKGITYPGYPAGAFRDLYNNLQNSFLAIGVGSLTRPDIAERIVWADKIGGDAIVQLGKHKKTAQQWKRAFEAVRITDPSASSFVQTTGKQGAEKATLYSRLRALRGQVDNTTRTQLAAAGMRMGMELEDAARMVHEFLYNYAELSPFDRDIMRRLLPFYVFPRKTIGLYPKIAAKNPGRLANLNKMFQGRDSENQEMTTWEGEGYKIRLDKNGRDLTVLNGVDLPVRSFDMLWSGSAHKTMERLIGSAHPIPKVYYMLSSGRDPFRGREMTRMSAPTMGRMIENWPEPIKNWVGWRKRIDAAGRPIYTVNEEKVRDMLEITMTSRIFSTSDAYFRDQMQEEGAPDWWLRFLTGLQKKTLNLDAEKAKQLEQKTKIAIEEKVKQGELNKHQILYRPTR